MSTADVIVLVSLAVGYVVTRYGGQIRNAFSHRLAEAEVIQQEFEIVSPSSRAPKPPKPKATPKPASRLGGSTFHVQKKSVNLDARCLRTGRVVRTCHCPAHRSLH